MEKAAGKEFEGRVMDRKIGDGRGKVYRREKKRWLGTFCSS